MNKSLFGFVIAGLLVAGSASAVPCGFGGVVGNVGCVNGAPGDFVDTASDLNAVNAFGSASWQQLDRTSDGVNAAFWNVSPGTGVMGTLQLAAGVWNSYSEIAVAVSSATPMGRVSPGVQWSAYLLPASTYGSYLWTFDWQHSASNLTLYAVAKATRVAEPATLALVMTGLFAVFMVSRRRSAIRIR